MLAPGHRRLRGTVDMTRRSEIDPADYDARRIPRGTRTIDPLRRSMHREFIRFMLDARRVAQRHLSTWKLADRSIHDDRIIQANLIYWSSHIKTIDTLIYQGTCNDSGRAGRGSGR